jgi:hypothetical protein
MNERLTELYRSCRPKEALASQDQFQSANALLGSDVEKFAELIVKECIKSLWTEECHTSDLALEEYNRNSKKIKQHFGVEE